jgi:hypothetical protein
MRWRAIVCDQVISEYQKNNVREGDLTPAYSPVSDPKRFHFASWRLLGAKLQAPTPQISEPNLQENTVNLEKPAWSTSDYNPEQNGISPIGCRLLVENMSSQEQVSECHKSSLCAERPAQATKKLTCLWFMNHSSFLRPALNRADSGLLWVVSRFRPYFPLWLEFRTIWGRTI